MRRNVRGVLFVTLTATVAGASTATAQRAEPRGPQPAPVRQPAAPAGRPAAPAAGRPASPANRPPVVVNDAKMKPVLVEWERRSAKLKTLLVKIARVDKDPAWNESQAYEGVACLQAPNLACVEFKKVQPGKAGKPVLVDHERIVCTGGEVWQYLFATKQIFVFPLDKETKKRAQDEGPLPFLFNMRAAEAEARYQMNVIKEDKDYYVIGILPKLAVDKESFSQAFLQLDKATYLPKRIVLVAPNGKASKDYSLYKVETNVAVNAATFKGIPLGPPWEVKRDVGEMAAPPAAPRAPRVGAQTPAAPRAGAPRSR